jgi:hypothetical protein
MRRVTTAEDGEAFIATPPQDHPPGEWATVAAAEAKVVEVVQDRVLSDHRAVKRGDLGDEQGVQGTLLFGGDGVVFGAFLLVAAAARHCQALLGEEEECRRMHWAISVQGSRRRTAASM